MKLTKGQVFYRARPYRRRDTLPFVRQVEELVVEKVGTTYITIAGAPYERYLKATLQGEYTRNQLYLTAQEVTDEWARVDLRQAISRVFDDMVPVPLATLRQIAALLPDQLVDLYKPLPTS